MMFWQPRQIFPTVSFATCCWEKDWRHLLCDSEYMRVYQVGNHRFPFQEKILIINNVLDLPKVIKAASALVETGVLTRFVIAEEIQDEIMRFFQLERKDFTSGADAIHYPGVNADWVYYNALGPLAAIYTVKSDYLLYLTGDVRLDQEVSWIEKALSKMEKNPLYKVANLTWNEKYSEAKAESYKRKWDFYVAKQGFSDQMFLVKSADFKQPIYGEIREDSSHFPRGDVWEKRVFSYMKNRGWERITYRRGSYTHKNF